MRGGAGAGDGEMMENTLRLALCSAPLGRRCLRADEAVQSSSSRSRRPHRPAAEPCRWAVPAPVPLPCKVRRVRKAAGGHAGLTPWSTPAPPCLCILMDPLAGLPVPPQRRVPPASSAGAVLSCYNTQAVPLAVCLLPPPSPPRFIIIILKHPEAKHFCRTLKKSPQIPPLLEMRRRESRFVYEML